MTQATPKKPYRTLDLKPDPGEMIKPAETVDIIGTEPLTLEDRRVFNRLVANAHGPNMGEIGREFKIPIAELRATHKGNERVAESIERLMKTVVRHRVGNTVRRFQLLGGNDMEDTDRTHGFLTYSFDRRLVELLESSTMFAKLELAVIAAFQSKYALALYEHVARRINMRFKFMQDYTVEEIREILGVPDGKLTAFGSLKQRALDPAITEVNGLADFSVAIGCKRTGKKITHVTMSWWWKDREGRAAVRAELGRVKMGRRERIRGITETVMEFDTSGNKIERKAVAERDLCDDIPL
ncbi:MAG: replication initiation protein [Pseudomonadota bacterium]|nr:replication initiation protein [Pseudomonadota bacterium]